MSAKKYTDGVMRIPLRVDVPVGRAELIDAVAYELSTGDDPPPSREAVLRIIRGLIASGAMGGDIDDDTGEARERAAEIVDRLFPDLTSK